jgi:hypothetical protein
MENHRGASHPAEQELTAAGHRVHRCHEGGARGFPCVGITDPGSCPVDQRVDVALVVRDRVSPRPKPLEQGVSCAIRAGVPVVEQGSDILDPYTPWIAERVAPGFGVAAACERAAAGSFDALKAEIARRTRALLTGAALAPDQVTCRVEPDHSALRVELWVDGPVDRHLQQALAVRVLDAVRSDGRTFGPVDVEVVSGADAFTAG